MLYVLPQRVQQALIVRHNCKGQKKRKEKKTEREKSPESKIQSPEYELNKFLDALKGWCMPGNNSQGERTRDAWNSSGRNIRGHRSESNRGELQASSPRPALNIETTTKPRELTYRYRCVYRACSYAIIRRVRAYLFSARTLAWPDIKPWALGVVARCPVGFIASKRSSLSADEHSRHTLNNSCPTNE